jgi:predicted GIY-YIG superfamily endonuclease
LGRYILTNKTQNNKVYVGQSKNLAWRVPQHFDDAIKGNRRVYNDFNNGDSFTIRLIR